MKQGHRAFPEGAVACAPGDYLVCHDGDTGWSVYQVEDLLLVQRVVPLLDKSSTLTIESDMLDSMTPAYFNELHLLLTVFDPRFNNEQAAQQAMYDQTLTERTKGLLRPARAFSKSNCRVIRLANMP